MNKEISNVDSDGNVTFVLTQITTMAQLQADSDAARQVLSSAEQDVRNAQSNLDRMNAALAAAQADLDAKQALLTDAQPKMDAAIAAASVQIDPVAG